MEQLLCCYVHREVTYFRGDEKLFAFDFAAIEPLLEHFANRFLVAVHVRGVDVTVSAFQCPIDRLFHFLVRRLLSVFTGKIISAMDIISRLTFSVPRPIKGIV